MRKNQNIISALKALMIVVCVWFANACTPPPVEEPDEYPITTAVPWLMFDWTYSEQSFEVESEVSFVADSDADWLILGEMEFEAGRQILTVAALENPEEALHRYEPLQHSQHRKRRSCRRRYVRYTEPFSPYQ